MEEQKHMIVEHLSENSRQMSSICTRVTESGNRQDIVFTEAKQLAKDMKEQHDTLAELIQTTTGSARQMMETFAAAQTAEHTSMGQSTLHGKEETKNLWPSTTDKNSSWPPNTDHVAIRNRAMGVLNLMESFPHTPPTWLDTTAPTIKPPTDIDIKAGESICTKCKQQDIGLLFCDRCPEAVTLYHPTCLIRIEGTSDRVCDQCWDEIQALAGTPSAQQETTIDDTTSAKTVSRGDNTPRPTTREALTKLVEANDSDSSDMSSSSASEYNPTFRPSTRGQQKEQQLQTSSHAKTTNKHVATTKTSPLQTRAARKAGKTVREDAYDTSEEEEDK
jgi:hypothetical protein